jgi:hypothetical protein
VPGVVGQAVAAYLGVYRRSAGERPAPLLEHEDRGTLGHHEPVPPGIEGTARAPWILVAGGHGPDDGERAEAERRERRLGSAGDHDIRLVPEDGVEGLADGDGA